MTIIDTSALVFTSTATVLAALTDAQIAAVFSGLTGLILVGSTVLKNRSDARLREAAQKEHITTKVKLSGVIATLAKMHADGNSTLGNSKLALATTQMRLAQQTQDPADFELAHKLKEAAEAHAAVQADLAARQIEAEAEYARLEKEAQRA